MSTIILAIESSCDDTAASVIKDGNILANIVASQEVHRKYGGIVPELASRAHQQNIIPVVSKALVEANITKFDLTAVAFTQGPGLLGSLLVGVSFAKSLAMALGVPIIAVNHMHAHIMAHFIDAPVPAFPFICLTVSGGHTQIVLVKDYMNLQVLGETMDDAVGEAFDKAAKMLGLPYPGGPLIDKYAISGNPKAFKFPEVDMPELNFSFSGIKTSFLYFIKKNTANNNTFITDNLSDLCASFQYTLIKILVKKIGQAVKATGVKEIAIAGGVAANSGLRKMLQEEADLNNWKVYIPKMEYCTDNAAMIAIASYFKFKLGIFSDKNVQPEPRMNLSFL